MISAALACSYSPGTFEEIEFCVFCVLKDYSQELTVSQQLPRGAILKVCIHFLIGIYSIFIKKNHKL